MRHEGRLGALAVPGPAPQAHQAHVRVAPPLCPPTPVHAPSLLRACHAHTRGTPVSSPASAALPLPPHPSLRPEAVHSRVPGRPRLSGGLDPPPAGTRNLASASAQASRPGVRSPVLLAPSLPATSRGRPLSGSLVPRPPQPG